MTSTKLDLSARTLRDLKYRIEQKRTEGFEPEWLTLRKLRPFFRKPKRGNRWRITVSKQSRLQVSATSGLVSVRHRPRPFIGPFPDDAA